MNTLCYGVNTESECNEVVHAAREFHAVLVNITETSRTETEELERLHQKSAVCKSNYGSVSLAPFFECLVFKEYIYQR